MSRESFLPLRATAFKGRSDALAPAPSPEEGVPPRALGAARADEWLGGGLRGDGVHEIFATADDLPNALGFATLLALSSQEATGPEGGLLWLRRASKAVPYGSGLVALGLVPETITLVTLADTRALLGAALDVVRTGATRAVLIELIGRQPLLDLTATRRLVLAAAQTGTFVLIVRADAEPGLSAAHSRWQVRSAPSTALDADAPGAPVFNLTLLRQRGGREGLNILLEWNRDTASFHEWGEQGDEAPLSGGVAALVPGAERPAAQGRAA
ncbi:MAG TPA: hypothetical protein VF503_20050 [Sphingobium sp.]|uniref:ImuA family protein n=1 Tax=Sphingobium sp. TaxID=1912891 RepID=UPI002ED6971D